ncbi:centrosomal protein of 152 kDa isoform X1 [Oreochromis aureus]|uniref:CEP152 CEP63 binding coiled coil domain-containing protein n=1 Tax=Oreochromis aureus TaxID=47969 RepID=A0A668TC76_OREAU|nr:centrosomal protein of 152 kDa isoform X1 [Oreochromis aureus]XP_039471818.1 centrosomal protein of 152 kDa isoform X1 [Oreochromis aureus]
MSIDFDSAALQTQHDEEEYDQEDYAREQELHKLLTDLPDDMLEDSIDFSSPELDYTACSNKNTGNSPQSSWTQQWSDHPRPAPHTQNYEDHYDEGLNNEYAYKDGATHINGHRSPPQSQPLPHTWNQDHQFTQADYTCTSMGTDKMTETSDFSTEFESKPYPQGASNHVEYNGERGYMDKQNHQFQSEVCDRGANQYKVSYNPHHPAHQPNMFKSQAAQQGQFDHLQRDFLDSTQQNADREQLAQLQILNKAQQRQIEDLEQKLEDSRRNMRYLEHQFVIVKDEKDGLAVSLKEASRLIEEAKEREVQMQNKLKAMEQQVQILTERDHENMKKQRVADAAVDSMKQQMLELRRSDTLSRAREQHDRDLAVIKEQHEAALLALQQKLDSTSQALNEQLDIGQKLREHVKLLEHQREEEQLERARVVNALTQRLEESQKQCAKLLQTNSVQEMSQMQIKLQQALSAKALSENMNKVLQEDMADLKEQIALYESAVKHGVIAIDLSSNWENQLSESCVDLGLKKTNRKNGMLNSPALAHLSDSKLPKDEALRLLRVEMQRCLGSLKGKRQKINQLQEELQQCQRRVNEMQIELDETKLNSEMKETSQKKHQDMTGDSQKELMRLQEDKTHLQEQVELLEKKNQELKENEEKLKSANSELCTKMREMIQELDQEKQEAAERSERIHQQYRNDVVNRVRTELMLEHDAQVERLTTQHQQQLQQLQGQLSEANDKVLAVQECYISVCKEKDLLEESIRSREKEEKLIREESGTAMQKLRSELEAQHQASVMELKAVWSKEKEAEFQQQLTSHLASAEAAWKEELQKIEKTWAQRLEEATREEHRKAAETSCQTDENEVSLTISAEELDSRLSAQRQQLQLESENVRRKAVEEARKQVQRELQEKHLDDMAKQVEGAVTRAYNRWIEDLTSLPEYQAALQTEKEKWEQLQEKHTQQQVSQALKEAEEQWRRKHKNQQEENSSEPQRMEELQEELAALQSQLEQVTREQAALLKAELAGARAAWNRDKQQEIAIIQARSEQVYQAKLQEQGKKLEQAVHQAKEDADLQKNELLLQMEAKLQQTVSAREEEWRCQHAEKELMQGKQIRDELQAELQTALAEVQAQLLRNSKTDYQGTEDTRRTSGASSEATITHIIQTSCRDIVKRAVTQAKKEWKTMSEENLSRALKETQERQEREIKKMQTVLSQQREQSHCKRECSESVSKLQKKNQELQRHLEKTCRQLQHSVREHKTAIQHLKDEHESVLQRAKEEHLQQLEEVKRATESSGSSGQQQKLQQGLEEMKQQYLMTVEKIRGDMLRYLQESRERAAEMIRREVQRERQDTARKMRRYYLTCLQELLEDGGKTAGAEKKIMNAASKLAAMAKVLETPIKSKSAKNQSLQSCSMAVSTTGCPPGRNTGFTKNLPTLTELPDFRTEERSQREKTSADSEQKPTADVRTKLLSHLDIPVLRREETSVDKRMKPQNIYTTQPSYKSSHQTVSSSHMDLVNVSVRCKSREMYMQGGDSRKAENHLDSQRQRKPVLIEEAPVRDEKQNDWSMTSGDSDTDFQVPRLSYSGRKVEPVKPFSVSAASASNIGEFGSLSPDVSDLTVYNEIAKKTPDTEAFVHAKRSMHREPTPGSECEKPQEVWSRPLFSELRQRQQDSGFDSPFYQQK